MESPTKQRNGQAPFTANAEPFPEKSIRLKGLLLLLTACIACPCHLPITLVLLGGTAFGLFLTENLFWVVPILGIYFVWAFYKGFKEALIKS